MPDVKSDGTPEGVQGGKEPSPKDPAKAESPLSRAGNAAAGGAAPRCSVAGDNTRALR